MFLRLATEHVPMKKFQCKITLWSILCVLIGCSNFQPIKMLKNNPRRNSSSNFCIGSGHPGRLNLSDCILIFCNFYLKSTYFNEELLIALKGNNKRDRKMQFCPESSAPSGLVPFSDCKIKV